MGLRLYLQTLNEVRPSRVRVLLLGGSGEARSPREAPVPRRTGPRAGRCFASAACLRNVTDRLLGRRAKEEL